MVTRPSVMQQHSSISDVATTEVQHQALTLDYRTAVSGFQGLRQIMCMLMLAVFGPL